MAEARTATRLGDELGDAEIDQLHPALGVEQDILRLDVAMQHAFLVGSIDTTAFADLADDLQGLPRLKRAGPHRLAKIDAVDEFHEQVEEIAGLAEVVDGDDVGVREFGEQLGLALESLGKGRVGREGSGEQFERGKPVELRLPHLVDRRFIPP